MGGTSNVQLLNVEVCRLLAVSEAGPPLDSPFSPPWDSLARGRLLFPPTPILLSVGQWSQSQRPLMLKTLKNAPCY